MTVQAAIPQGQDMVASALGQSVASSAGLAGQRIQAGVAREGMRTQQKMQTSQQGHERQMLAARGDQQRRTMDKDREIQTAMMNMRATILKDMMAIITEANKGIGRENFANQQVLMDKLYAHQEKLLKLNTAIEKANTAAVLATMTKTVEGIKNARTKVTEAAQKADGDLKAFGTKVEAYTDKLTRALPKENADQPGTEAEVYASVADALKAVVPPRMQQMLRELDRGRGDFVLQQATRRGQLGDIAAWLEAVKAAREANKGRSDPAAVRIEQSLSEIVNTVEKSMGPQLLGWRDQLDARRNLTSGTAADLLSDPSGALAKTNVANSLRTDLGDLEIGMPTSAVVDQLDKVAPAMAAAAGGPSAPGGPTTRLNFGEGEGWPAAPPALTPPAAAPPAAAPQAPAPRPQFRLPTSSGQPAPPGMRWKVRRKGGEDGPIIQEELVDDV